MRHKVLDATVMSYAKKKKGFRKQNRQGGRGSLTPPEQMRDQVRPGETQKGKEQEAAKGY